MLEERPLQGPFLCVHGVPADFFPALPILILIVLPVT
jgi:hypothetical protein